MTPPPSVAPPAGRPRRPRRRRPAPRIAAAAVVALALVGPATVVADAGPDPAAGTISGTVRDASGTPVGAGEVCVTAGPRAIQPGGGWPDGGAASTDAQGRYVLRGFETGGYVVEFRGCPGTTRNLVGEYSGDTRVYNDATRVALADGGGESGVDAQLDDGTEIRGVVTAGTSDATPLVDACVSATGAASSPEAFRGGVAATDGRGAYVVRGLPELADGYHVLARECGDPSSFVPRWYGGDFRRSTAAAVRPTVATPAADIDVRLDPGATIAGTVREEDGTPVDGGVCVSVSRSGAPGADGLDAHTASAVVSDASGRYAITGLPAGDYAVAAASCGGSPEPRDDLVNRREAPVPVTAGATASGVDFTMRRATTISGRVYDGPGTGSPLGGVCVRATDADEAGSGTSGEAPFTVSAGDGSYRLTAIDPRRRYRVAFVPCGFGARHATAWWEDATTAEAATPVTSSVERPATGIDAHLVERPTTAVLTGGPAAETTTRATTATFAFRTDEAGATFECRLDEAAFAACDSPHATGPLADGRHTFDVRVRTWTGRLGPVTTRSWTVARDAPTTSSEGDVERGVPFSTDPGGSPGADSPVVAELVLPAPGRVVATQRSSAGPDGAGYAVLGRQLEITATAADGRPVTGTVADPIALALRIDASALPADGDLGTLSVQRDGVLAPDCSGVDGTAAPDPCVAGRSRDASGDVTLRILTTHLSVWDLVRRTPTDPGPGTGAGDGSGSPGGAGQGGTGAPAGGTGAAGSGGPAGGTGAVAGTGAGRPATGATPGPGTPTTGGPGGPTTVAPPPAAPRATLGTVRVDRLAGTLRSGLRLPVRCSASCALRVRVTVDGRTARTLRLVRRARTTVVASATGTGSTVASTVVARFTTAARRALRTVRTVRLTATVTVGDGTSGATRRVVVVRR